MVVKTEEDKMKLRHRSWNRYELNTNLLPRKNDEWNTTIVCGRITTRLNLVEHLWLIMIAKRCEQFQMCASALCFDSLHILFLNLQRLFKSDAGDGPVQLYQAGSANI